MTALGGWFLLLTLVYAPWALGSLHPWTIRGLGVLCALALALWLLGCAGRRQWPRVPLTCLACIGLILFQGWGMAFNARSAYDPAAHGFIPRIPWSGGLPGAVDADASRELMLRLTFLLGILAFVCDLGRQRVWRTRLWWTMALTGVGVVLFGLLQKAGVTDLTARYHEVHEGIFFATYNYHGNAGSFINLVFPLTAGLTLAAARRRRTFPVLIVACLLCLIGAAVNVSRAAQGITVLLLALLSLDFWIGTREGQSSSRHPPARIALMVTLFAVLFLATAVAYTGRRWSSLPGEVAGGYPRAILSRVTWPMAKEAGAWGFGPGSFKLLLPHSRHMVPELYPRWIVTRHVPGERVSIWSHAHNDYIQTIIEWGWVGAAALGILLLGGLFRLGMAVLPPPPGYSDEDRVLLFCSAVALLGGCLHALVDFPFQIASLQLYAAVYLGLGWGSDVPPR